MQTSAPLSENGKAVASADLGSPSGAIGEFVETKPIIGFLSCLRFYPRHLCPGRQAGGFASGIPTAAMTYALLFLVA